MKRIICAIAVCLLLCGCADPVEEDTQPPNPAVTPTEPSGSYEPGSALEAENQSAVRIYPQNRDDIWAIRTMGRDVLVFSGVENMILTRLTGDNLFRVAETELNIFLSADAPSLHISDDRLLYFDYLTRELVQLDADLREVCRMALPEDMVGEPCLTRDRSKLYYCTAEGLRAMDMDSGISRLVKQMWFAEQTTEGLLMGDTVVRVSVMDEDGNGETLFLDAQTGAMVGGANLGFDLSSGEKGFYAVIPQGLATQMVFGNEDEICQLHPADYRDFGIFLPKRHGAVLSHWEEKNLTLHYYDLATGRRTASLELGEIYPGSFTEDDRGLIYFLYFREDGTQAIGRWDPSVSSADDSDVYTGPWYTLGEPDEAGLAECQAAADRLSQKHGIQILLGTDVMTVHPEAYDLVPEYQVPIIRDGLIRLEKVLAHYPEGFFESALSDLEDGAVTLCLARNIRGSHASGNLEDAEGIYFREGNHSYVVLAMGDSLESCFYNEMFHVLEPRLLSQSIACYRWDELNPKGFDYDYDYAANKDRDGSAYLEDTTRSFIDTFSMSFPKEDRARVMEYGCMPGNENYFISYAMQKKLRALCEGIREAYGLQDFTGPLIWEQYLESPIT